MIHLSGLGAREKLVFIRRGSDWRIEAGVSKFLVAEGSGWSAPVGVMLFKQLRLTQRNQRPSKYRRIAA